MADIETTITPPSSALVSPFVAPDWINLYDEQFYVTMIGDKPFIKQMACLLQAAISDSLRVG
jgi:hypothetical protein